MATTCPLPGLCATKEARDYSRPLSLLPSPTQSSPIRRKAQVKHDEEALSANPLSFHCVTALIARISQTTTPLTHTKTCTEMKGFALFPI